MKDEPPPPPSSRAPLDAAALRGSAEPRVDAPVRDCPGPLREECFSIAFHQTERLSEVDVLYPAGVGQAGGAHTWPRPPGSHRSARLRCPLSHSHRSSTHTRHKLCKTKLPLPASEPSAPTLRTGSLRVLKGVLRTPAPPGSPGTQL